MLWYIAAGGAIGSVARYLLSTLLVQRMGPTALPWGTLVVNLTGSFVLGFVMRFALATPVISPEVRAFLTVGFCGGYTTFSTFSYETMALLEEGQTMRALVYIGLSVALALLAMLGGFALARELTDLRRSI
ncbi:MAG: fluoride efflux transporter CrcB [Gemmatimonadota bacterium]